MPGQSAWLSLDHVAVKVTFCAIRKDISPGVVTRACGFHTDFPILHLGSVWLKKKGLGCLCCIFKDSLSWETQSLSFGHFCVGALGH